MALPIIVIADVLPGKPDPAAEAHFANAGRAGDYAQDLADSGGYYGGVFIIDQDGQRWPIAPKEDAPAPGYWEGSQVHEVLGWEE